MARMTFELEGAEIPDFLSRMATAFAGAPAVVHPVMYPIGSAEQVGEPATTRRPGRPRGSRSADPVEQYNKIAEATGAATIPTEPAADTAAETTAPETPVAEAQPETAGATGAADDAGPADELNPDTALVSADTAEAAADPEAERQALLAELTQPVRDKGVPWIKPFVIDRFKVKRLSELNVDQLKRIKADIESGATEPT